MKVDYLISTPNHCEIAHVMHRLKKLLLFSIISINTSAQNYEEAKVPAYTLPAILSGANNKKITSKSAWEKSRRPELLALFEQNVYGHMPTSYDSIRYEITNFDDKSMAGKATLKEIAIKIWKGGRKVRIELVLFIPNKGRVPAPAFLLINNRDRSNVDPARKTVSEFWPAELLIDSGFAISAFHVSDAAPDDTINYKHGMLQLYPEQLQSGSGLKAIGAWAWAASRVMDYFEKEKSVDASKIALVGHSRGGKAALWTGAQDRRFAMIISNCSGNTGAALSRRRFGETIRKINTNFPHWFAENYKMYNDKEAALPVDQHMLLSLIAPRPLYVTSATKDLWADPRGSYLSLKYAQEAYRLYLKQPSLPSEPPAINKQLISAKLGYHNREGIHNLTIFDWKNFIRFANQQWK